MGHVLRMNNDRIPREAPMLTKGQYWQGHETTSRSNVADDLEIIKPENNKKSEWTHT